MPLIRIAPLIRFLSKAHPLGSPIYVTASQHVPFASTAFGIQRSGISESSFRSTDSGRNKNLEPAKNPPSSLLRPDSGASVGALWATAKAETTLRKA